MTDRQIATGETSSYRYIGVQPPLPEDLCTNVLRELNESASPWTQWSKVDRTSPDDTEVYTEFCANVGAALDSVEKHFIDAHTMEVAQAIGSALQAAGDTVEILEPMITTDFVHPLFGIDADQTRSEIR